MSTTEIAALRIRMEERFDTIDAKFDKFNARVAETEQDMIRIKTVGYGVLGVITFLGWDHIKPWMLTIFRS